jgi:hypothetical protein
MVVSSASVVVVGFLLLKLPDAVTMIAVGITLIITDMTLRFRRRDESGWITRKDTGGYLYFFPVWIFGIIVIAINIINGLQQ